jgi:hypothetical protein
MELIDIPEHNNETNIYSPSEILKGSLNDKLVFLQNANADITKSGKINIITVNCRCIECINSCVQGSQSGGKAFQSFADYYKHICDVIRKEVEIFKCPCKGCPWSIVRSFGAMVKHLRLEHSEIHEEFSTLCNGDFSKLWISIDNNTWTALLKFKKPTVIKTETVQVTDEIKWDNDPSIGNVKKSNKSSVWIQPPKMKITQEIIMEEFPSLNKIKPSMTQLFIGPLEMPTNIIVNDIEYYAARAPWDIELDSKNKIFIGTMPKNTTFYVGFCPNERPLTIDEKRSADNHHYCLDENCSFDHMAGWSKKDTSEPINTESNDVELEQIFPELSEITLNPEDIENMEEQKPKTRRRKNNKENLEAFEND